MKRRILATAAAGLALLGGAAACTGTSGGTAPGSDEVSLVNQGVSLGLAGQIDQAKAIFERVVAANPTNKVAWFDLGYIAQMRNDPATAAADYDKSLALDPNYSPSIWNKAILLERSDVDGSIALYRRILALYPNHAQAHLRVARLLDKKGDKTGARHEFNAAVAADPKLRSSVPASYRQAS